MAHIRIAHITDLHARQVQPGSAGMVQRRSRIMFELLSRTLGDLRSQSIDLLAVTGDLLDVPDFLLSHDDYYDWRPSEWRRDAEADYRLMKQTLDACGIPYIVLPGNHDLDEAMWRVFDRADNERSIKGYRVLRFCDREGDCHVPRRLERARVLWESALSDGDIRPQIHLQHYVITPDLSEGYPHSYYEHEQIRSRNASSGKVVLSLSGHYHAGTELIRDSACHFATTPAFCEFPNAYRIFDIEGGNVGMQTIQVLARPFGAGRRVVFLDRDGVITALASYDTGPEAMALIEGSAAALRRLREFGFATVVITSQSCVGYGYVTRQTMFGVNDRMCRLIRDESGSDAAEPDAIFFSVGASRPCHPDFADMSDAKPEIVNVIRATELLGLDLRGACMIGDRKADLELARRAGIRPILVRTGDGHTTEEDLSRGGKPLPLVFENLNAAVEMMVNGV